MKDLESSGYPQVYFQVNLLDWAWPEPGRCNSPEASTFTSKISQNEVLNVRNDFQPSLSTIPKHILFKSYATSMKPSGHGARLCRHQYCQYWQDWVAESKLKFWSSFQTYPQKSHKKKPNMENIINRKQNGVRWLKSPNESSVLLSHKKHRVWETLRKLPLPKYFSFDRENSFWRKTLFL